MLEFLPPPIEPATPHELEVRILTTEEIQTLEPVFTEQGVELPNPSTSFIMGAVCDGKVVGFLVTQLRIHSEPMHIEPGFEHVLSRLIHQTEGVIAQRVGTVDVFLFAPAGRVARLAQMAGMRTEPWVVMSKRVVGMAPDLAEAVPESSESEYSTEVIQ